MIKDVFINSHQTYGTRRIKIEPSTLKDAKIESVKKEEKICENIGKMEQLKETEDYLSDINYFTYIYSLVCCCSNRSYEKMINKTKQIVSFSNFIELSNSFVRYKQILNPKDQPDLIIN